MKLTIFSLLAFTATSSSVRGPPKVASSQLTDDFIDAEFDRFVEEFGRKYSSNEERERRRAIFFENYRYVVEENEKDHEYTLGINVFADMPKEDFMANYMGLKVPQNLQKGVRLPNAPESMVRGIHYRNPSIDLPSEIDWETKGAVAEVKNQGQCGSCWSFSTTGALEGRWEIHSGKLQEMSEQQLVDCSAREGNQGCNGGIMDYAFEYIHKYGICSEADYEYDAEEETCKSDSCTPVVPPGGVSGFMDVHPKDPEAMMDALQTGPVSIAIQADQMAFQMYHDGVLTAPCGSNLNHGVLLVGYGVLDGTKYWKVKNSWGPEWGKDGYILLSRNKGGSGECGLLLQASYPVVNSTAFAALQTPSNGHYGKPPNNCASDEIPARLSLPGGKSGMVCAPECNAEGQCPTDVPQGVTAMPQCAFQSPDKKKFCALICEEGSAGQCGDAECVPVQGQVGICMYPAEREAWMRGELDLDVGLIGNDRSETVIIQ